MVNVRLEGVIIGFDEYMNLVLDDVEELNVKVCILISMKKNSEKKNFNEGMRTP